ncbi:serine--tRNA ligase, partial [Candidatus Parcubacteria bacterium]|nr:serine--tRNA ligase [Candidatus Parcubacteria bacterium]
MLDIKFIREHKDFIKEAARKKRISFDVDSLVEVDDRRKAVLTSIEGKKAEQNKYSLFVANPQHLGSNYQKEELIQKMTVLKNEMKAEEEQLSEIMKIWQELMLQVPNIPDMSVPEGESENDNQEIRIWGDIPTFSFPIKNHIEICEEHDLADFERGTKISGFRGYILKGAGAQLEFALWQYTMNFLINRGYNPMIVPSLVKRETLLGSGYLPQGEEDLYKTQDDQYLAGTGEVATMSYYSGEVLDKKDLPKKMVAFSPCFRREAGSHSKDTKGLIRVHEFFKLEQVILCEASHELSVNFHEELLKNTEDLMQELELPHRVILMCTADIGLGHVKKYDIEAWVPSQNTYRETHSASYFHDFQTRRLNIRYKDDEGKLRFAHSLNNTAIATPRVLVSILENNQQEDG